VLSQTGTDALDAIEAASGGGLTAASGPADRVLVNGQHRPVITQARGQWYRWRVAMVSLIHHGTFVAPGCELGLLAKDGVYLLDGPRPTEHFKMASGNRVDLLVRCSTSSTLATSTAAAGRRLQPGGGGGGGGGGGNLAQALPSQAVASIVVVGGASSSPSSTPSLQV
jgi:FtsP/CotA-like multicopper oxidase with cupredoxin domain